ncbi:MAG: Ribonuclease BN, partial [uncultured Nocardioidaceae bacterium]
GEARGAGRRHRWSLRPTGPPRRRRRARRAPAAELAPGAASRGAARRGDPSAAAQCGHRLLRRPVDRTGARDGAVGLRRGQHPGPGSGPALPGRGDAPRPAGAAGGRPADEHHHRLHQGPHRARADRPARRPVDRHHRDGVADRRPHARLPRDRDPRLRAPHAPGLWLRARRRPAAGSADHRRPPRQAGAARSPGPRPGRRAGRRLALAGRADERRDRRPLPVGAGPQAGAVALDLLGCDRSDGRVGGDLGGAVRLRAVDRHLRVDLRVARRRGDQHVLALDHRPADRRRGGRERGGGTPDGPGLHGRAGAASRRAGRRRRRQRAAVPRGPL